MPRCYVIFNANAGTALALSLTTRALTDLLVEHGLDPIIDDDEAVPLEERIARAVGSDAEILVAAGGDGTITALANAMVGTDRALGILPLGTVNALAKDLNIPLELGEAMDVLAANDRQWIDVGEVDGRFFLHKVVIGLIPALAAGREHIRGKADVGAKFGFLRFIFRRLARARRFAVAIDRGDGKPKPERVQAVAVASNSYVEGVGRIFSRDRLDQGELSLYILRHLTARDFIRLSWGMLMGHWQDDDALSIEKVDGVTIHAHQQTVKVMFDGEVESMRFPLHFRIRHNALCVVAPAPPGNTPADTASEIVEEVAP